MFQEFFAGSTLLIWPTIGLVFFVVSFAIVLLYAFVGLRDKNKVDRLKSLPLEPDAAGPRSAPEGRIR